MLSLSSGQGGTNMIGLGFDSSRVEDVKEQQDNSTVDPDISFPYLEEKLRNVLGHFQKDFEGGVSVENLGPKYGGYGSFLSAYKRHPSDSSSSKHSQIEQIPPFFEDSCGARQSILGPSSSCTPGSRNSLGSRRPLPLPTLSEEFVEGEEDKVDVKKPSSIQCFDTEIKPDNQTKKNFLKFKIKLGPNDVFPRKNAEIYSGLGLDTSPSPSTESPERGDLRSTEPEDSLNDSPNNIIQTMTTFPVPEEQLLSPLPDYLISLAGKQSAKMRPISKCRSNDLAYMKNNSSSLKYDGTLTQSMFVDGVEEKSVEAEEHIVPLDGYEGTAAKREASCSLISDKKPGKMVTINEEANSGKKVDYANDSQKNSRKERNPQGVKGSDFSNQKGSKKLKAKTPDPVKKKSVISRVPKEVFDVKNSKKYLTSNEEKRKSGGGDRHRGYLGEMKLEDECNKIKEVPKKVSKKSSANHMGSEEGMCIEIIGNKSENFSGEVHGKTAPPPHIISKGSSDPDPPRSNVSPGIVKENWVCCDICQTWRLLPITIHPDSLPEKWTCSMLDWLPGMNNCSFSEEETSKALIATYQVPAPETQSFNVDGRKKDTQLSKAGGDSPSPMTVKSEKSRSLRVINESSPVIDFESRNEGEKKINVKNIGDEYRISSQENMVKMVGSYSCKSFSSDIARKRAPKHSGDTPSKTPKFNIVHGRETPITKSKRRLLLDIDDQSTEFDNKDHLSESAKIVPGVSRKDEQVRVKKAKLSYTEERQTAVKNVSGRGDLNPNSVKDQNSASDLGHFSTPKKYQSRKNAGSLLKSVLMTPSISGKLCGPKKTKSNIQDCVLSSLESVSSRILKVSDSDPRLSVSVRRKLLGKGQIQKRVSSPLEKIADLESLGGSKGCLVNSRDKKPRIENNKAGYKSERTTELNDYNCDLKSNSIELDINIKEALTTPRKLLSPNLEPQIVSVFDGKGGYSSVIDNQSGKRQKVTVQVIPGGVMNYDGNMGRKDPPSQTVNNALKEARRLKHMADRLKNSGSCKDSIGLYFQAALKFLHVAYLLESCSDSDGNWEVESGQMYRSTAGLFQFCAHEYEKLKEMALAALSFKCVEVACMRVVYCSHSVTNRDRHELQMSLQGQSPSSSSCASDVDNVNNPLTAARFSAPEKGGVISPPQPGGDLNLDGKRSHCMARLLNFISDVNCGMESSRRSQAALTAAASSCSNSGVSTSQKDGILLVRKVLDFGFNDVDAILQLIRVAMDPFS